MKKKFRFADIPLSDLDEIASSCELNVKSMEGLHFCILGGTGFIGKWLTSSLLHLNDQYNLHLSLDIITRNASKSETLFNVSNTRAISFHEINLARTSKTLLRPPDVMIHGATASSIDKGSQSSDNVLLSTINGFNFLKLQLGESLSNKPVMLHLSSGAVYGNKSENRPLGENDITADSSTKDLYTRSKILGEEIVDFGNITNLWTGINARLFTFIGPHLPLNEHFAIGNFMHEALNSKRITIKGNAKTIRSYMYPSDLCEWLIKLIANKIIVPIHIGSDLPVNMRDLAEIVKNVTGAKKVYQNELDIAPNFYYPSTKIAKRDLGLNIRNDRHTSLQKWQEWLIT